MTRRAYPLVACAAVLLASALRVAATDLHIAVRSGDLSGMAELIRTHPQSALNERLKGGVAPLHLAAAMNDIRATVLLIKSGADPNVRTSNGFTPLHWAASRNALDVAEYLIVAGADVNAATETGITPIHWAASNNATNVVELLLAFGADHKAESAAGLRPLHWAVAREARGASMMLAATEVVAEEGQPDTDDAVPDAALAHAMPTNALRTVALGEALALDLGEDCPMPFVWVPGISTWVARYETTNRQFRRFLVRHNSGSLEGHDLNADEQPCVAVSWRLAKRYTRWLNAHFQAALPAGHEFRLPTGAEWEHFAACGDERIYPWGDSFPPVYGNYSDAAARTVLSNWRGLQHYHDGYAVSCPVSKSGANEWGLYGVGGNVWEWCEDWYDDAKQYRTRRGGSWHFDGELSLRMSYRGFDLPTSTFGTIGFRVVAGPSLADQSSAEIPQP